MQVAYFNDAISRVDFGIPEPMGYYSYSNFPKAIKRYKKSLNIARKAGDRAAEGDAYFSLGIAYHSHSDFPKAIGCFENSLTKAKEAGERAGVRRVIRHLRICYLALGDFSKAVEYGREYVKMFANGVGSHTEEAAGGRTYHIQGNFHRPFCEFRNNKLTCYYTIYFFRYSLKTLRFIIMRKCVFSNFFLPPVGPLIKKKELI